MNDLDQLAQMISCWRDLIRSKQTRYDRIKDPKERILPALKLVGVKTDLRCMEDEYCSHIKLDLDYAVQDR